MQKVFIVGCGRSGTTMLQQALNRHPQIVIPPETAYFIDFLGHSAKGQRRHLQRINADLGIDVSPPKRRVRVNDGAITFYDQIADRYATQVGKRDAVYFGDKTPQHLLKLPRIARLLPRAKIILIYRDGRDVAMSLSKVPWSPNDLYVNFAIWLRFYRWQVWAKGRPDIELLCVQYERLVREPHEALRRITDFLGLPYDEGMAVGHGNQEGIADRDKAWKTGALGGITTSRIETWKKELRDSEIRALECWGGKALRDLGYTLSTDGNGPLPPLFFPRLVARHLGWRIRRSFPLLRKELFGG